MNFNEIIKRNFDLYLLWTHFLNLMIEILKNAYMIYLVVKTTLQKFLVISK